MKRFLLFFAGVFLFVSSADARDTGLWAIGGLLNYHQPTGPLSGWYAGDLKYGLNVSYVVSPRLTTEVEYHYSKFRNSNLPGRTFEYKGRQVSSPEADSEMTWNSVASKLAVVFQGKCRDNVRTEVVSLSGFGPGFLRL